MYNYRNNKKRGKKNLHHFLGYNPKQNSTQGRRAFTEKWSICGAHVSVCALQVCNYYLVGYREQYSTINDYKL